MIKKVVYNNDDVVFVFERDNDKSRRIWYWVICCQDVGEFFEDRKNKKALNELANQALSIAHCDEFANDPDNSFVGVSCGDFETVKEAINDYLNA